MSTWADRIKSRMKELGLTQEELASKLGITRGAVTHYLAGRRVPPLRQFHSLAAVLKTDPAWLQFGKSNEGLKSTIAYRPIPILSWEQATQQTNPSKLKPEDIKEFIPHFFTDQLRWYALRVKGDSMVAMSGKKSFNEGDIIIVDPDKTAKHGDFIIAVLPRAKEVTFKQYVIDGGIEYLKPLNTQYPLVQISKGTSICGVVIEL